MKSRNLILLMIAVWLISAAGCRQTPAVPADGKLRVVATTTIVADIVRQVGGDYVNVTSLVPIGVDEHEYQPSPQDIARVSDAGMIFENGLGLEQFLDPLVKNAGGDTQVISVSEGIIPLQFTTADGVPVTAEGQDGGDPHVWMNPENVKVWVKNIQAALSVQDPAHETEYNSNAQTVLDSLTELDSWINDQVNQIPAKERMIVTDHLLFGYFADRYGFQQVGAVIPSYSSSAEPSAKDIAALENAIRQYGVKAIFVGEFVNTTLAQRVAEDTSIQLIKIYTGSLSPNDGPAATYQDYMRYNVNQIVHGITGTVQN